MNDLSKVPVSDAPLSPSSKELTLGGPWLEEMIETEDGRFVSRVEYLAAVFGGKVTAAGTESSPLSHSQGDLFLETPSQTTK